MGGNLGLKIFAEGFPASRAVAYQYVWKTNKRF